MRASKLLMASLLVSVAAPLAAENVAYGYDPLGRVVKVGRVSGPNNGIDTVYHYDQADNLALKWTGIGAPPAAPPPFAPAFMIVGDARETEGQALVFTVRKAGSTNSSFSVNFATGGGTAVSGGDFTATSGTLVFGPAEYEKTVSVATLQDTTPESAETFSLSLGAPSGGATLSRAQATGTIDDDHDSANRPPVTASDFLSVERCTSATINVVANDSDPDGDPFTLESVSGSSSLGSGFRASATNAGFSANGGTGTTSVTYTVRDSFNASATGTLTIRVTGSTSTPCE